MGNWKASWSKAIRPLGQKERWGMSVILQRQVTLDEAILGGFKTYNNGCNFKLVSRKDGFYLQLGCYSLINLMQGNESLLLTYLAESDENYMKYGKWSFELNRDAPPVERKLDGVSPDTIRQLLERKPCRCCGGFLFEKK